MLRHGIPGSESAPPLYYLIASMWSHVFGTSEVAVRSLTALVGVATVAVAYAIGVELRSRRAGLILAAFVAVSPLMVWYSQDARAYGLLIFLTSLGLLFFARSPRTASSKSIWLWAFASAAALTTHYFAIFLVVPEAVALLLTRKTRPRAVRPAASVAAIWVLLLPLLLHQRVQGNHLSWIKFLGLTDWLKLTLQFFDSGSWNISFRLLAVLTALIAVVIGLAFVAHRIHRRELLILGVGASGIVLPVVAVLVGFDYANYQNLLVGWMPFAAVLAVALAGWRRVGAVLAVVLGSLALGRNNENPGYPSASASRLAPGRTEAVSSATQQPLRHLSVLRRRGASGTTATSRSSRSGPDQQIRSDVRQPPEFVRTRRLVILAEDPWVYSAAAHARWVACSGRFSPDREDVIFDVRADHLFCTACRTRCGRSAGGHAPIRVSIDHHSLGVVGVLQPTRRNRTSSWLSGGGAAVRSGLLCRGGAPTASALVVRSVLAKPRSTVGVITGVSSPAYRPPWPTAPAPIAR